MLESETEAVEFYKPYSDIFIACKNEVNRKVAEISTGIKTDFESRTHSTIWNDLMSKELKRAFQDIFIPMRKYAQTTFNCANKYHLKTKKMDDKNRILFTPTQSAIDFLTYNIQLPFPVLPDIMKKIILGYKLNKIHTEIEDVYLAYPNGESSFLWMHKIEPALPQPAKTETTSDSPSPDTYTNRQVRPRNITEKKEDDER